jgi:hypothetical protein
MGIITRNFANNILSGGTIDATDGIDGAIPSSNIANTSVTNITTLPASIGDTIESVASDPSPVTEGQFWYNSTTGALKGLVQIQAWSSAGNLANARTAFTGCGTQTSALAFGGGPPNSNSTEEYSGYTWATGGNLGTARRAHAGAGTQTAGLAMAGFTTVAVNNTEEYDGSSWGPGGNMATAREGLVGAGTQTAGLGFGGYTTTFVANTEEYDGSAWTAGGNLGTARYNLAGAGTQTAGLAAGGKTTVVQSVTEEYNGSTWTSGGTMNTARSIFTGSGTQNLGLVFGGNLTPTGSSLTGATELYDGTTWVTSSATMGTSRRGHGGAGSMTAGLAFGGTTPANTAATEEFNSTIFSPATGAWASGGNTTTARDALAGSGTQTAGLIFGGFAAGNNSAATEEYDGSTWGPGGNLNTARRNISGFGIQTASIAAGGASPGGNSNATESYNGSTWTSVSNMNTARGRLAAANNSPQTAGLIFAGNSGSLSAATESWNGTSWTSVNSMNTARNWPGGLGTQTAALAFGGNNYAGGGLTPTVYSATESWNGTSWTTVNSLNVTRYFSGGTGIQTAGLAFGGSGNGPSSGPFPNQNTTELWDGTNWSSAPPMTTARAGMGSVGTQNAALGASGYTTTAVTNTEEWSLQTTATASTLTTS